MSDKEEGIVSISIDMKKHRIRIHKATLHLLGDPKYIQILFKATPHRKALSERRQSGII